METVAKRIPCALFLYMSNFNRTKRLIETLSFRKLFPDNLTGAELRTVTDSLIDEIINLCDAEESLFSLFRTLHYTRFRLQSLDEASSSANGMEKKMYPSCSSSLTQN